MYLVTAYNHEHVAVFFDAERAIAFARTLGRVTMGYTQVCYINV